MTEFSKKAVSAIVAAWFFGVILGAQVIIVNLIRCEVVPLADYLMYIGAPMTGGIVSYMLKSAFENREKIRRGNARTNTGRTYPNTRAQ